MKTMDITCIVLGLIFIMVGILFACGKLHARMKAWKMMSEQEKNKINISSLCLNIGEVIMLNGFIFLFKGCFTWFSSNTFTLAIIAWMIVVLFDVWFISRSDRYSK